MKFEDEIELALVEIDLAKALAEAAKIRSERAHRALIHACIEDGAFAFLSVDMRALQKFAGITPKDRELKQRDETERLLEDAQYGPIVRGHPYDAN